MSMFFSSSFALLRALLACSPTRKCSVGNFTLTLLLILESIGGIFCQSTTRILAEENRHGAVHLDLASVRIRLCPPGSQKAYEALSVPLFKCGHKNVFSISEITWKSESSSEERNQVITVNFKH